MKRPSRTQTLLLRHAAILLGLAVYFFVVVSYGIGCPIRYVSGIPCPTCGISRAWAAALRGNLAGALRYHPLFWLALPLVFAALHRKVPPLSRLPRKWVDGALVLLAVLFLAVWIVRLLWFSIP